MVRDSNSGHQLLFPPAKWCPMFASRTTQAPLFSKGLLPGCRAGPEGVEVLLTHAVARIMLDGSISRRRDCHSIVPPSTFIRCVNRDKKGVSSK